MTTERPSNFIAAKIDDDLKNGKYTQVVTRFPPEPNGYLHIGHAKSICLNFGLARDYEGRCHLRMDDTNPAKEDTEFVESIKNDVRWLGFDWGEHMYYASDYFPKLYEFAVVLINKGLAYVDSLTVDEIREYRGSLTESGKPSPYRDRPVDENLDLFARMKAGEFPDGTHVLRAKIDMAAKNMLMRDPLLYRIRHAHHHRTGDAWCIYPMYDYAHCLSDAIEGITHSICTLEFENNRELYDWVLEAVDFPRPRPEQTEFAKLALDYTVMSKRNLRRFVEEGTVDGWNDPRMPTIAAIRRRGVTPEAIRAFAEMVGVAKANSVVDLDKLDFCIRDDLNHKVRRVQAVLDPIKVTITNWPEGKVDELDASYYPHDVPLEGSRKLPFSGELYIERADFMEEPSKKFFRLAPGREVRLRYGYYITCLEDGVVKDDAGNVVELRCTYDPDTRGGTSADGRKIRGTLHWVSAAHAVDAAVRVYDRLFSVPSPGGEDRDVVEDLNPDSLKTWAHAKLEPSIAEDPSGSRYQFERQGYFISDVLDSKPGALVFNRIVGLRDTWAKLQKKKSAIPEPKRAEPKVAGSLSDDRRPDKKSRADIRAEARAADPVLEERYDNYIEAGLSEDDADLLSGERALGDFFDRAADLYPYPAEVARWVVNELAREAKDAPLSNFAITPEGLAELTKLVADGVISNAAGRKVFTELLTKGGSPADIVKALGLEKVDDAGALVPLVEQAIADNPSEAAKYREGKRQLIGFFIGKVMQATKGSADAKVVRELVQKALG